MPETTPAPGTPAAPPTCDATGRLGLGSEFTCDLPAGHDGDWHYRYRDGVEWRLEMSVHARYVGDRPVAAVPGRGAADSDGA